MTRFRSRAGLCSADFADGTLVLDPSEATRIRLDRVGQTAWAGLATGETLDQLVARVVARFSAPPERVKADLQALLGRLEAGRWVEAVEDEASPSRGD